MILFKELNEPNKNKAIKKGKIFFSLKISFEYRYHNQINKIKFSNEMKKNYLE